MSPSPKESLLGIANSHPNRSWAGWEFFIKSEEMLSFENLEWMRLDEELISMRLLVNSLLAWLVSRFPGPL